MFIAQDKQGTYVQANVAGTTGEFYCPGCLAPVYLRQGEIKQPHFAHRAGAQCHTFSDNETPQHLAGKLQLAAYCQKFGQVTLEAVIPAINQRPDILITRAHQRIAIEYQCSPISQQRLDERNAGYRQQHITVIWILGATYYQAKMAQRTIVKFLANQRLCFYLPDTQKFYHRAHFEKPDFGRVNYSEIVSTQLLTTVPKHKQRSLNVVQQIYKLQQLIAQKRVDQRLITYLYLQQRLLLQAPLWIHLGQTFGLTISNWQWRLQSVLVLEKIGVGHVLHQQIMLAKLKPYVLGHPTFQQEQVMALLQEMVAQHFIVQRGAYFLVIELPVWYGSLRQKLGQVRK